MSEHTVENDAPTYEELALRVDYLSASVSLLRQVVGAVMPNDRVYEYADALHQIDDEYRRLRDELTRVTPPGSTADQEADA